MLVLECVTMVDTFLTWRLLMVAWCSLPPSGVSRRKSKYLCTIVSHAGGGGIDMGWLDGMTGCGGECNIDGSSVTFTNFELWA